MFSALARKILKTSLITQLMLMKNLPKRALLLPKGKVSPLLFSHFLWLLHWLHQGLQLEKVYYSSVMWVYDQERQFSNLPWSKSEKKKNFTKFLPETALERIINPRRYLKTSKWPFRCYEKLQNGKINHENHGRCQLETYLLCCL